MQITINAKALADAVGWTAAALANRYVAPVLGGILIETSADMATLSAFDYDTSRRITIPADVTAPDRALLPGRVLAEIAKALPKDEDLDITIDSKEAVIRCGRSEFALPLMPVEDFPTLPAAPDPVGSVDATELAAAVAHTATAVGRDPKLPMLTGICVDIGDGCIDMGATDRYRMTWRSLAWEPTLDGTVPARTLIPADILTSALRGLPAGPVIVGLSSRLASLTSAGRTVTIGLLDPEFIDYKARIGETKSDRTAEVDAAELAQVVKRVALLAERMTPVRLSWTDKGVLVEAGSADVGRAAELVDCKLNGDGLSTAFNPAFLIDGLNAVGGTATFHMLASAKPVLLTGTGDPELRYLVVPIRLSA
ncbi:DNA polymerase III subunit beta [Nonomuraea sp. NPDC050643]|uniref:DNA polymerase III subunit beta n=1 Tax=Nonomuraea sp. NPDC050643 TaxID=3155660 RepID=UPI0033D994A6